MLTPAARQKAVECNRYPTNSVTFDCQILSGIDKRHPLFMKFNFFKKRQRSTPAFEALKNSPLKDLYFYRAAPWYWLTENMITINDNYAPRVITLDPWPQMIFLDATGKLTISEYVDFVGSKYKNEIPTDLDTIILSMIELLLKDKVIRLSDVLKEPAPAHNRPFK